MWGNFIFNKSDGSNYWMFLVFTKLCLYIFVAVHGVRKGSCYFLLPWLAFHVIFIAGLFVAIILIICFALPFIYRLFALIPAFAAILFIFAWSKVILNFYWLNYWHTCAMYAIVLWIVNNKLELTCKLDYSIVESAPPFSLGKNNNIALRNLILFS